MNSTPERLPVRLSTTAIPVGSAAAGDATATAPGIVICSVGTLDGQDMMLRRIGLLNAPDTKPVQCEQYGDLLQVMYCDNLQRLSRGFCELMDHMAEALQLGPPSC
jgi:hypothetical protein